MKRDPWQGNMRFPTTMHGFAYVFNNPVRFNDPNGLQCNDTTNEANCTSILPGSGTLTSPTIPLPIYTRSSPYAGLWYILAYISNQFNYNVEDIISGSCNVPGLGFGAGIETTNISQFTYERGTPLWLRRDAYLCAATRFFGVTGESCGNATSTFQEFNQIGQVGFNGPVGINAYGQHTERIGGPHDVELGIVANVGGAGLTVNQTTNASAVEFSLPHYGQKAELGIVSGGASHVFGIEKPKDVYVAVPGHKYNSYVSADYLAKRDFPDLVRGYNHKFSHVWGIIDAPDSLTAEIRRRARVSIYLPPGAGTNLLPPGYINQPYIDSFR